MSKITERFVKYGAEIGHKPAFNPIFPHKLIWISQEKTRFKKIETKNSPDCLEQQHGYKKLELSLIKKNLSSYVIFNIKLFQFFLICINSIFKPKKISLKSI